MRKTLAGMALFLSGWAGAQAAPPLSDDATVTAAQRWMGRGLILRGFYGTDELKYDASGKAEGTPKAVDWTLAGFDLQAVSRVDAATIELDGVRVAIHYNPDAQIFERRPQKDEKIKLLVADGRAKSAADALVGTEPIEDTLAAIFSVGIDPALQRSMPMYWRHYFDPKAPWPADGLDGQTVYPAKGAAGAPAGLVYPQLFQKTPVGSTPEADRDKIRGTLLMHVVVDASGAAKRPAIIRPVGYGLDARAAQALSGWKFQPAELGGKPVAAGLDLSEELIPGLVKPH